MVQALEREHSLRERVVTTRPTSRVEKLRQRYLDTKDKVVLDLLRIRTRSMKETEGEPQAIRQAKTFAALIREMPVNIYPDELFVGWLYCEPRGSSLSAGQEVLWKVSWISLAQGKSRRLLSPMKINVN